MTGTGHGPVAEPDVRLAACLADWLVTALADADVRLVRTPEDTQLLRDGLVRSLPLPLREAAFPIALIEVHGQDVHARLRSLFAVIPPQYRLDPASSVHHLRALIGAQVQPVQAERFYQLVFQGELPDMLWNVFRLAVRHLVALGSPARLSGPDADHLARRLDMLGLADRSSWAVRNEMSGTVHGPVIQAGAIHGGVHVSVPGEPGPGESPIAITVAVAHCPYACVSGFPSRKVGFSGHASVSVLVEATGARAVVLSRLRPVVVTRRAPGQVTSLGWHLGGLRSHVFRALLEQQPPRLVPVAAADPRDPPLVRLLGTMFRSRQVTDFPFTVAPLDPGLFVIDPRADSHDIEWRLEMDWTYQGRSGTIVIEDEDGQPFLIGPAHRP